MNFPCILPNVASLCFQWVDFGPINCAIDVPVLEKLSFIRCRNIFHFDITAPKLCSLTIEFCSSTVRGKFLPVNLDLRSISTLDLGGHLQGLKEFSRMGFHLNVEYLKLSCDQEFYTKSDGSSSMFVHLLRLCPKLRKLDIKLPWIILIPSMNDMLYKFCNVPWFLAAKEEVKETFDMGSKNSEGSNVTRDSCSSNPKIQNIFYRDCPFIVRCFGEDVSMEHGKHVYNLLLEFFIVLFISTATLHQLIKNTAGYRRIWLDFTLINPFLFLKGIHLHAHPGKSSTGDLKPQNVLVFPGKGPRLEAAQVSATSGCQVFSDESECLRRFPSRAIQYAARSV
nr:F-box/FBD/LRR-repeat protein At1g13570-like isoform X1 [Ipomoea batatas]